MAFFFFSCSLNKWCYIFIVHRALQIPHITLPTGLPYRLHGQLLWCSFMPLVLNPATTSMLASSLLWKSFLKTCLQVPAVFLQCGEDAHF